MQSAVNLTEEDTGVQEIEEMISWTVDKVERKQLTKKNHSIDSWVTAEKGGWVNICKKSFK